MKPFDANGTFRSVRTAAHCVASPSVAPGSWCLPKALGVGVQMVGTVVLARLLTPADFGVVTMVTIFSVLLSNFG